jgi:hypothetical protein
VGQTQEVADLLDATGLATVADVDPLRPSQEVAG